MRRELVVVSAVVAFGAAAVFAQSKRNFAGTWTLDAERTAAANQAAGGAVGAVRTGAGGGGVAGGGMRGGAGSGDTVARASGGGGGMRSGGGGSGPVPVSISLDASTFTIGSGSTSTAYRLDGTQTSLQTLRGPATAKANWQGDTLVIETVTDTRGGQLVQSSSWSLDGDNLLNETSSTVNGTTSSARKTYYKRKQ